VSSLENSSGAARRRGAFLAIAALGFSGSCFLLPPPPAGIGEPVPWRELPGWREEDPAQAWPALLASCQVLAARDPRWTAICAQAQSVPNPEAQTARAFFETYFEPHVVRGEAGAREGLITGYYEPLLYGSRESDERFRYPLYGRPDDLLIVELGELFPALAGQRVRGRLQGNRVVPYPSRAQIEGEAPIPAAPLVWVDDLVALFFLHIQGSGRVQLPDGSSLLVSYADQNGHPYRAIGRTLIDAGALALEDVSMQSIRAWLRAHPEQLDAVLHSNPSYVFFEERPAELAGPRGALGVGLQAERSIAVDPQFLPLGSAVWLDTTLPGTDSPPYRRLVFAQDTGGAIRGPLRVDVFFGFGERAEDLAGRMKQPGQLYALQPRLLPAQPPAQDGSSDASADRGGT
jgi:membrane-bound lytic murein transglycosylase A